MSNIVDVAFVFDTQKIEAAHRGARGEDAARAIRAAGLVFMITNVRFLYRLRVRAGVFASVKAHPSDVLRVRAWSLSGQSGGSVIVEDLVFSPRGAVVVEPPRLVVGDARVPIPERADPSCFQAETRPDPRWEITVAHHGIQRFAARFSILHFDDGSFTHAGRYTLRSILEVAPVM